MPENNKAPLPPTPRNLREGQVGPRVLPPTNVNTTAMPVSAVPPLRVTKGGEK
jgi:hypothetical protein